MRWNLAAAITGAALLLLTTPLPAQAGLADHPVPTSDRSADRWGLTSADWMVQSPASLRRKAGLPSAIARVKAGAESGDAKAAALLSGAYASGTGVAKDMAQGFRWAKAASQAGLSYGHYVLATYYQRGSGGASLDPALAASLFKRALDAGVRLAAVELAIVPRVKETKDIIPSYIELERLLDQAADEGTELAKEMADIIRLNRSFSDALRGKPLWKDSRGLLLGHVDYSLPLNACMTLIRTTKGRAYSLNWIEGYKAWRPQATSFVVEGRVYFGALQHQSFGGPFDGVGELGIFLLEKNNRYTPEETREIFGGIERDARSLSSRCGKFR